MCGHDRANRCNAWIVLAGCGNRPIEYSAFSKQAEYRLKLLIHDKGVLMTNNALVCGAGRDLVTRLKREGFWFRGVDLKFHEHSESEADGFAIGDLRDQDFRRSVIDQHFDEVYLLAADMGGVGAEPVNIGSEEMVTINRLVDIVADIAGKQISKAYIPGPQGVSGFNSDNHLIRQALRWEPTLPLRAGLEVAYPWIEAQVHRNSAGASV
jgi:nucleoside-diphosphate-sugar epimerase